jgi:colanic acid/amylovoran biosynthesis glycosyltransferase
LIPADYMLTVAYLTNEFPVAVEPYVAEEIWELRRRGTIVIAGSVRRPRSVRDGYQPLASEAIYIRPFKLAVLISAVGLCINRWPDIWKLCVSACSEYGEPAHRRVRALAHTWLGICYAVMLRGLGPGHIHIHHGYYAAWVGMTAARLLGISYSMTLHGSDLLLHHAFLRLKLESCKFCLTVSEFNRHHILANYPGIAPEKIRVQHLGVPTFLPCVEPEKDRKAGSTLIMLSVGRLHPVKDHAFLLRACRELKTRGFHFACLIAGDGPERRNLENLIFDLHLRHQVTLLGHVPRARLENYYAICDLVVLTSRSEGIPLTLMEAMAHRRVVLAPAITGIPELVRDGETGFLYEPGSVDDFARKVQAVEAQPNLSALREKARRHVLEQFDEATNLAEFAEFFPKLVMEPAA